MLRGQPALNTGAAAEPSPEQSNGPGVHLARAFRSLALTPRYEARSHRIHDRAFETLRGLQQARGETNNPEHDPSTGTIGT
jgi:hypothetical protein